MIVHLIAVDGQTLKVEWTHHSGLCQSTNFRASSSRFTLPACPATPKALPPGKSASLGVAPMATKLRIDINPTPVKTAASPTDKSVCLSDWWLIRSENDCGGKTLAVAGLTSNCPQQASRLFHSAPIVKRYDPFTLKADDGMTIAIHGPINVRRTHLCGFSRGVCSMFFTGFPYNWEVYADKDYGKTSKEQSSPQRVPSSDDLPSALPIQLDELPASKLDEFFLIPHGSAEYDMMGKGISMLRNWNSTALNCHTVQASLGLKNGSSPSPMTSCVTEENPGKNEIGKNNQNLEDGIGVVAPRHCDSVDSLAVCAEGNLCGKVPTNIKSSEHEENRTTSSNKRDNLNTSGGDEPKNEILKRDGGETVSYRLNLIEEQSKARIDPEAANIGADKGGNGDTLDLIEEATDSTEQMGSCGKITTPSKRKTGCLEGRASQTEGRKSGRKLKKLKNDLKDNQRTKSNLESQKCQASTVAAASEVQHGNMTSERSSYQASSFSSSAKVQRSNNKKRDRPGTEKGTAEPFSHVTGTLVTPESAEQLSFCPPESLNLKKSRSGRLLIPTLAYWRNQKIVYDVDGGIAGITMMNLDSPAGGKPESSKKKRR